MPDPTPEEIFVQHLPWIDKVAAIVCRRNGVWGDDAEDFASWTKMKLMEDDYAVFRKFEGKSKLETYIGTVVTRLFIHRDREERGRWRPSTEALRMGPPAPELEQLVHRDGYTVAQAGEKLRTAGVTGYTDHQLARLLASLRERTPMRPVQVSSSESVLEREQAPASADAGIVASETDAWRSEVLEALNRAMRRMEPEEQMIVRMHFGEGRTLAHVARALNIEQKPLYRRIDRLRDALRGHLEAEGLSPHDVRKLLDREDP